MRTILAAAGAALSVVSLVPAVAMAEPAVPAGKLALSTERVVVFKDGYGLFTKTATATADADGRVWTDRVPDAAILGTFWALGEGNRIVGMRAEWDERREIRERETPALTTLEILRANPGRAVTLVYGRTDKDKETYAGTLVEVLETPEPVRTPVPGTAATGPAGETVREIAPRGGQLLVLDTSDRGRIVLPVSDIRSVSGKDLVTRITRREEVVTRSKRLSFDLGKEAAGRSVKLRVFHFSPGVRWIPTYRVGGNLDAGKAEIALQAEILNEEEDLVDAAIDLVVGVPNFRFKGTVSPLSLERVLQNALAQAAPQLMGQSNALSNASFASRSGEMHTHSGFDAGDVAAGDAPELPGELTAAAAQDHFVYSVKSFSLRKGGRATVPLWQTNAPVRHLYTLDVDVVRSGDSYSKSYASLGGRFAQGRSPLRLEKNQVWHQLELSNPGNMPWTTGAAFVTSGFLPVAQELLAYTPAGGRTRLPLTIAPDIRGEYDEEELERRASARKWNGVTYALLKKKGTVTVKNHRKEKATMQVRVSVGGRAERASSGGTIRLDEHRATDWSSGGGADVLNNHSDVTWELTLAPGETRELDYTFSFYTR